MVCTPAYSHTGGEVNAKHEVRVRSPTSQANRHLSQVPVPSQRRHWLYTLHSSPPLPPECQARSGQPGFRLSRLCNLLAVSTGEMKAACLTPQSCDEGTLTGTTRRKAVLILKSKTNVNGYYLLLRIEEIKIVAKRGSLMEMGVERAVVISGEGHISR